MSRDIVDSSTPADRLVVTARIEGEPADQLARLEVEDADVARVPRIERKGREQAATGKVRVFTV